MPPKIKSPLILLLFLYLIAFCLFFYAHPVKILSDLGWFKGFFIDLYPLQVACNGYLAHNDVYMGNYSYPPFFAIVLSPVFRLPQPYHIPILMFLHFFMITLIGFFYVKFFAHGLKKMIALPVSVLVIICSIPVLDNFKLLQTSLYTYFFIITAYVCYKKRKYLISGSILAVAAAIKIFPGVFVIFFFFNLRKNFYKFLAGFTLFLILFLVILPVCTVGYKQTLEGFNRSFNPFGPVEVVPMGLGQEAKSIIFRYLSHDYTILITELSLKKELPVIYPPPKWQPVLKLLTTKGAYVAGSVFSILFFAVTIFLSAYKVRMHEKEDISDLRFCVFLSGLLLFIPYSLPHYFILLTLPNFMMLSLMLKNDFRPNRVLFILFLISFLPTTGNYFLIKSTYWFETALFVGLFFWSNCFLFIALFLWLKMKTDLSMPAKTS